MKLMLIPICLLFAISCRTSNQITTNTVNEKIETFPMPLTGLAENQKGGAVLITDSATFWMDQMASWDYRYYKKPVRVWGTVELRADNPVFLDTSEVKSQGIPAGSDEELSAHENRYWILDYKIELIRP